MHRYLLFLLLPVMLVALCACHRELPRPVKPLPTVTAPADETGVLYSEEAPLIAAAQTWEEAEEIGALYGITLVDFSHGVALYHTEEDPRDVIRRGQENGWPELTLNYIRQLS